MQWLTYSLESFDLMIRWSAEGLKFVYGLRHVNCDIVLDLCI